MDLKDVLGIVSRIKLDGPFDDKWFHVGPLSELHPEGGNVPYIQLRYMEPDIYTGIDAEQRARVWIVLPEFTPSQVVQICFGAALASAEHQVREFFSYDDSRVYGPHMTVDDLASVAR